LVVFSLGRGYQGGRGKGFPLYDAQKTMDSTELLNSATMTLRGKKKPRIFNYIAIKLNYRSSF
jgi:hypothetical protein